MKTLILTLILAVSVSAQTVSVSQGFVDDAAKAFIELRAERAVNAAQTSELEAKTKLILTQSLLIDALTQSGQAKDLQIAALSKIKCDSAQYFWIIKTKRCH